MYARPQCSSSANAVCVECHPPEAVRTHKYLLNAQDCDNTAAYKTCDECTPPRTDAVIQNCGDFDLRKGRPQGITEESVGSNPRNPAHCLPCVTCQGRTTGANGLPAYYHADAANQNTKCVTDAQIQCVYTHRDKDNVPRKANEPFAWIRGKKRVRGAYRQDTAILYKSLSHHVPEKRDSDTLPYYEDCSQEELRVRPGYRLRNPNTPPPQGGSDNYMTFESWSNDCSTRSLFECAEGFYFDAQQSTFSTLVCKPCSTWNPGGLVPYCQCPHGWANNKQILIALIGADQGLTSKIAFLGAGLDDVSCTDCKKQVKIHGVHERIYCSGSTGKANEIRRCAPDEFLDSDEDRTQCKKCSEAGAIPSTAKDECIFCERGKYSDGANCKPCDGRVEFCDAEGMAAPTPKRMNCSDFTNKMFKSNLDAQKDNECVDCPLDCGGEMAYVYAAGHNADNACSDSVSGKKFYACYDARGGSQPTDGHEFMRTKYKYNMTDGTASWEVDLCTNHDALLPSHASWVRSPTVGGSQCVFACKHGWHTDVAHDLRTRIRYAIYEGKTRIDLQPFLEAIEKPMTVEPAPNIHPTKKTNWPDGGSSDGDIMTWEREVATSLLSQPSQSRAHLLDNTFLFVDEVMQGAFNRSLCLAPNESYITSMGCPYGFAIRSDPQSLECALAARDRGVFSSSSQGAEYETVVLDAENKRIACVKEKEKDTLWIPYQKCTSCLDMQHQELQERLTDLLRFNSKNSRLETLSPWLHPSQWKKFYEREARTNYPSPYNFIDANHPCKTSGGHDSTAFTAQAMDDSDIRVSVPCALEMGEGNLLCAALTGSSKYKYDLSDSCQEGKSEIPCVFCNASQTLAADYPTWLNKVRAREDWAQPSRVCNYMCPTGFVSNPEEATYPTNPCLACEKLVREHKCQPGSAEYLDVRGQLDLCASTSSTHGGMKDFAPQCTACTPLSPLTELIFVQRPFANNSECLALCSPDTFRTLLRNASETRSAVPQWQIAECRRCTDSNVISCNNSNCSAGFFLNESCLPCNASRCEVPGFYRPTCPANSISDPVCTRCDEKRLLYNDAAHHLEDKSLATALSNSMLAPSRRFISSRFVHHQADNNISVFVSQEGCAVACINNYAWIDLSNGMPPSSTSRELRPEYACLPCSFLGEQLFSVWNHSRVLSPLQGNSPRALQLMQGRSGGCLQCPPNTETIASADRMCMTKPGFGQNTNSGVAVELVTIMVNASSQQGSLSIPIVSVVRSLFVPAVQTSNNRFLRCCQAHGRGCKTYQEAKLDINQWTVTGDGLYTRCTDTRTGAIFNYTKRALLQASASLEQCLAGQFNHIRGNTVCFSCPRGASTPSEGMRTNESCVCLSGYYAKRNPLTRAWEGCLECGPNRHRTIGMNDSFCAACPPGQNTPSTTSANCYCDAGTYYSEANQTCVQCEAGGYCESGAQRVACPDNSWSDPGAKTRSDCVCNNGTHYGTLADPGSVCYKTPPTMRCLTTCDCAPGWRPVYSTSADGLQVIKACVTECETGQYAIIDPVTFERRRCEACPLNTYSSSKQAVDPGEGRTPCTPCPSRFQTVGTGSTAPSQCVCLAGVSDAQGQGCGSCPVDTYLDPFSRRCRACPAGATSAEGSVGYFACMCAKGMRSSIRQSDQTLQCEPCPRNTYAASAGFSCTPCPSGMITAAQGTTSPRDCVCPEGQLKYAGECVTL